MADNNYEQEALAWSLYPGKGFNLVSPAIGLAARASEFADAIGNLITGGEYLPAFADYPHAPKEGAMPKELYRRALIARLGDVLWYLAQCASELDVTIEEVALANIQQLRLKGPVSPEKTKR